MSTINIQNVNLGGIAYSKYQGIENSVAQMVGFDLHSEPGIIKVNQKLTKESGTTVDDFVKCILPCSDGNTYLFGSTSGKIWKRISDGTYSLEATASPAAGTAGIKDALEDQGYIYYSMQSRIGRWQLGTAWSTRDDNWATFTKTDADFHPFQKVNLVNYVGDGNLVAQIEDGIFTPNALDVKTPLRIKALGIARTKLLLGTYVSDNVNASEIFDWNTWSVSFDTNDPIPEVGINSFLKMDNEILANAGQKGNIYVYDGEALRRYKRINGDWGIGKTAQVHPNAAANFNGLPLFGLSNIAGNPCLQGVYSLGSYSPDFPSIINLDYIISQNKTADIEIGALAIIGDIVLVSWKDGTTYGIDKLDAANKYSGAYLDTRIIMPERTILKRFVRVYANYRSLPTGTAITFKKSVNHGAFGDNLETVVDAKRKTVYTKIAIEAASTMQIRVATTASSNDAPEIENIEIDY